MRRLLADARSSAGRLLPWYQKPVMWALTRKLAVAVCSRMRDTPVQLLDGERVVATVHTQEELRNHAQELDSSRTKWVCPYPIVIMESTMAVGQTVRLLGITVESVQRWEREGQLVRAAHTDSNRRRNTENQLHTALESGHAPGTPHQA